MPDKNNEKELSLAERISRAIDETGGETTKNEDPSDVILRQFQDVNELHDKRKKAEKAVNKVVKPASRSLAQMAEDAMESPVGQAFKSTHPFSGMGAEGVISLLQKLSRGNPGAAGRFGVNLLAPSSPVDDEPDDAKLGALKAGVTGAATFSGMPAVNPIMRTLLTLPGMASALSSESNDWSAPAQAVLGAGSARLMGAGKLGALQQFAAEGAPTVEKIKRFLLPVLLNTAESTGLDATAQQFNFDRTGTYDFNPLVPGTAAMLSLFSRYAGAKSLDSFRRTPAKATGEITEALGAKPPLTRAEEDQLFETLRQKGVAEDASRDVPALFQRDQAGQLMQLSHKFDDKGFKNFFTNKMREDLKAEILTEEIKKFKASPDYDSLKMSMQANGVKNPDQYVEKFIANKLNNAIVNKVNDRAFNKYVDEHQKAQADFVQNFDDYVSRLRHPDIAMDKAAPEVFDRLAKQKEDVFYVKYDPQAGKVKQVSDRYYNNLPPSDQVGYRQVKQITNPYQLTDRALGDATKRRESAASTLKSSDAGFEKHLSNPYYQGMLKDVIDTGVIPPNVHEDVKSGLVNMLKSTHDSQTFASEMLRDKNSMRAFTYFFGKDPKIKELGRRQFIKAIYEDMENYKPPRPGSDNDVGSTLFNKVSKLDKGDFEDLMGQGTYDNYKKLMEAQHLAIENLAQKKFNVESKNLAFIALFLTNLSAKGGMMGSGLAAPAGFALTGATKLAVAYKTQAVKWMQTAMENPKLADALKKYWSDPAKHARLGVELSKFMNNVVRDKSKPDEIDRAMMSPNDEEK